MSIFSFFRKKKKGYRATYDELADFLEENNLLNLSAKAILREDMIDAFFPDVDQVESPVHFNFKETFRSIEKKQQGYFREMIDSNFTKETIEAFFTNYQKTIHSSFPLPSTNILFISYWHRVIEKLKSEVSMSGNLIDKKLSGEFFNRFEVMSKNEFERLTTP